jgi:hypothetical protein
MTLTETVYGTAGIALPAYHLPQIFRCASDDTMLPFVFGAATVTMTWVVSLDFFGRKLSDSLGMGSVLRTRYSRPGVSGSGLNTEGGRETPVVDGVGDKAVHPVVVDFNTGKVEGVNVAALACLQIYDC